MLPDDQLSLDTADIGIMGPPDLIDGPVDPIDPLDGLDVLDDSLSRERPVSHAVAAILYLDIETIPDESRMELFDLPPLPELPPETTSARCPEPDTLLALPLDKLRRELMELNPDEAYLEWLPQRELIYSKKPRAGVAEACKAALQAKREADRAVAAREKEMSLTPEFCRVAAVGWAIGDGPVKSMIDGHPFVFQTASGVNSEFVATERGMLEQFWGLAERHSPIVGFNVLGFDLQVIRARSILLGVEPSKLLNDSPYNNRDVTDLMLCRFGRGGMGAGKPMGLKRLAKLYGIPVPAGQETSGSDVRRLLAEDPAALGRYVESDIEVTRALHRRWSGYFCV